MFKVKKYILILTSGILWSAVGIMLFTIAVKRWFPVLQTSTLLWSLGGGLAFGILKTLTVFKKAANKNIERINSYEEKVNFFAFQTWQSYVLIAFMMGLGIFLRMTHFVPPYILAGLYVGIGFALFFSSLRYYKAIITKQETEKIF